MEGWGRNGVVDQSMHNSNSMQKLKETEVIMINGGRRQDPPTDLLIRQTDARS